MTGALHADRVRISLVFALTASCGGALNGPEETTNIPTAEGTADASDVQTNDNPPLIIETALYRERTQYKHTEIVKIRNGEVVLDGDRVRIAVETSINAYLYIVSCSQPSSAGASNVVKVYPHVGTIRVTAGKTTYAPSPTGTIPLDNQPGKQVIYTILSKNELAKADHDLADAIKKMRTAGTPMNCEDELRKLVAARRAKANPRSSSTEPPNSVQNNNTLPIQVVPEPREPDVHTARFMPMIERGELVSRDGQATMRADVYGVAILRYEFTRNCENEIQPMRAIPAAMTSPE